MLVLLCLFLLPSASADVDCHMACTHCRDEAEDAALVEVYCAMCRECRERRRERKEMQLQVQLREKSFGWDPEEEQSIPPGCPTAPPCSEETEKLLNAQEPATTCNTVAPTCPPVIPCKAKQSETKAKLALTTPLVKPANAPATPPVMQMIIPMCMPCGTMCPCPSSQTSAATATPLEEKMNMPEPSTKDFFYVYIGVPKDALNKVDK